MKMKATKFCPFIVFTLLINVAYLSGQITQNDISLAEKYFNNKRYSDALPYYLKMLESDSSNGDLNFKAGICYWNSRSQKAKSVSFLEKASIAYYSYDTEHSLYKVYKLLGDAYHHLYRFDEAVSCYEKCQILINNINIPENNGELTGKIEMCRIGKALKGLALVPDFKKGNPGKNTFSNSTSILSADQSTITFTFLKNGTKTSLDDDSKNFENILFSEKNISRKNNKINPDKKVNKYETTVATSVDGQIILTYRDEFGSASLYISCLKGNYWTVPEKLHKTVNAAGWETNEFVSADGSVMYFTSDRKGGYGGNDIYICKKLINGEWSKAINLGPAINSPYDEAAPFIHPDGKTFYFSSNGHNKDGDFEIFNSIIENNIFSVPVKVGFPMDTTKHTVVLEIKSNIPLEKPKSDKRKKNNIEPEDKKDNYMISFVNPNGISLTLVKGTIVNSLFNSAEVNIEVKDNETQEVLGSYLMKPEAREFAFILPPAKNNYVSFRANGFLAQSVNLDITDNKNYYQRLYPVELIPIEKDSKIDLNNVFFDPGKSSIRSASKAELNDLVTFMKNNPGVAAEIIGISECKSEVRENSRLCSERAEALVKYFIKEGIEEGRLNAKGYALKLKKSAPDNLKQKIEFRITAYEFHKSKVVTTQ